MGREHHCPTHMLWYPHLCATNDVVVVDYVDEPTE